MEQRICLRRKGGAPPNLQTKKSGPLLNLPKKENSSTSCSKTRRELPQKLFVVREESSLPLGKSLLSLENGEETSLLARGDSSSKMDVKAWKRTYDQEERMGFLRTSNPDKRRLVLPSFGLQTGNEKPSTSSSERCLHGVITAVPFIVPWSTKPGSVVKLSTCSI